MILHTDSYFSIGSTHTVCQDYALSTLKSYNIDNDVACALISDGCSSSIDSDIGSRLISKSAENRLKYYFPEEKSFRLKILEEINYCCDVLSLKKECLDATLLFLQADLSSYEIRAYGDGGILKLNSDDSIEFTLIEYPSGAPLYMNYYSDDYRFELYKSKFGLKRHVYKWTLNESENSKFTSEIDEFGEPYIESGNNNYKAIAIVSDGIGSFMDFSNKNPIPANTFDIVRQIMDLKSIKGKFIQRSMNGLNKYCEKNSLKHTDDFSIAGISFEK